MPTPPSRHRGSHHLKMAPVMGLRILHEPGHSRPCEAWIIRISLRFSIFGRPSNQEPHWSARRIEAILEPPSDSSIYGWRHDFGSWRWQDVGDTYFREHTRRRSFFGIIRSAILDIHETSGSRCVGQNMRRGGPEHIRSPKSARFGSSTLAGTKVIYAGPRG